jgi:hypothetical protein
LTNIYTDFIKLKILKQEIAMKIWEKVDGKYKKVSQWYADLNDLIQKANPSDDRILVQMTEQREFAVKKTESGVETIDDLLSNARDQASRQAKAKGHNYVVRIWCDGKSRQFRIEDWDEAEWRHA